MMTSNRSDINIASTSDLHLAHPRTNTYHIIQNLRKAFPDNEETAKLDLLLFAGDVFDRLMKLPQDEVDAIQEWIGDLLRICVKYDIIVRVLEGTPSHDWRQSKQFVNINSTLDVPADLRYVETLSIEVIEKLGNLSVLYVPDEWNADASVTLTQVRELMAIHGFDKVDIGCMHGSFDYQLPIESVKNHDSKAYLSLVRHYIVIGHVHLRSEMSLEAFESVILAQGSFDRLAHGEEAPKGHYRACISRSGNRHWFVENKTARLYTTLECRGLSLDEVFALMVKYEDEPDLSSFRLLLSRGSTVYQGIKELRKRFPQFRITTQQDELKKAEAVNLAETKPIARKPITVTPTNINHLVAIKMAALGHEANSEVTQRTLAVLDKYKDVA